MLRCVELRVVGRFPGYTVEAWGGYGASEVACMVDHKYLILTFARGYADSRGKSRSRPQRKARVIEHSP